MGVRGRKSAAELSIIGPRGVETVSRPEAPRELTGEQSDEWRQIVSGYEADRFDQGAQRLLAQYCRHVVAARRVAQLLAQEEDSDSLDLDRWDKLLKAQERQSERMASLATKLRITPQSRYTPQRAATLDAKATTVKKPWES